LPASEVLTVENGMKVPQRAKAAAQTGERKGLAVGRGETVEAVVRDYGGFS
jgi:hypothetical protein